MKVAAASGLFAVWPRTNPCQIPSQRSPVSSVALTKVTNFSQGVVRKCSRDASPRNIAIFSTKTLSEASPANYRLMPNVEGKTMRFDPHGFHRHLIHRKEAHYQGERVPEGTSFYEQVASALVDAKQIILIGHGTGKSSAVEFLAEYSKKHHPTVHERVIASEIVDLSALTEAAIEEIAKKHI